MHKTTIYVPEELEEEFESTCRRLNLTKAAAVRDLMAEFVERNRRPMPRAVGIFSDTEVTSMNVDDWLRENWRPE